MGKSYSDSRECLMNNLTWLEKDSPVDSWNVGHGLIENLTSPVASRILVP
jgi:hypothetical protein